MYVVYGQKWYKDAINFPSKSLFEQSAAEGSMQGHSNSNNPACDDEPDARTILSSDATAVSATTGSAVVRAVSPSISSVDLAGTVGSLVASLIKQLDAVEVSFQSSSINADLLFKFAAECVDLLF
jgi:hypothetical protein